MTRTRWVIGVALGLLAVLGVLIAPFLSVLAGLLHREHFYAGRPTSYWRREVERATHYTEYRTPLLDRWLDRWTGKKALRREPTVLAGDPAAVPVLIDLTRDENVEVRRRACMALGSTRPAPQEAVLAITEFLQHKGWKEQGLRWDAAMVLSQIGPGAEAAIPVLRETLRDEDPDMRAQAVMALGDIGGPKAWALVPEIIPLLAHPTYPRLRSQAAQALGQFGPAAEAAVPALEKALGDKDGRVPFEAAKALSQIAGPRAAAGVPVLLRFLSEVGENIPSDLCVEAAQALQRIGPAARAAIPALEAMRQHRSREVREAAAKALESIVPRSAAKLGGPQRQGTSGGNAYAQSLPRNGPLPRR